MGATSKGDAQERLENPTLSVVLATYSQHDLLTLYRECLFGHPPK